MPLKSQGFSKVLMQTISKFSSNLIVDIKIKIRFIFRMIFMKVTVLAVAFEKPRIFNSFSAEHLKVLK